MEDDRELRRYIRAIFRRWWLLALLAVLGGAAGFLYASQRTTTYTAAALLTVSRPLYAPDLAEVTQTGPSPLRTYGELALSDEVVQTLHDQLQASGEQLPTLELFRRRLAATAAPDTGLLTLQVVDTDGDRAVQTANAWADLILAQNLALYGPDSAQMTSYQAQLDTARANLDAAVRDRASYQEQNEVGLLSASLGNLQGQLYGALYRQVRYPLLVDDAQTLLTRLRGLDPSAAASTADEATLLLLVAQASISGIPGPSLPIGNIINPNNTDVDVNQQTGGPLQVQLNITGGPSSQSVGQLADAAQLFIDDLHTRAAAASSLAESLRPQVLQVQLDLAEANRAADDINRAVTLTEAQYLKLAELVEQAQIAAQDAAGLVRLASPASVPVLVSGTSRLVTAAVGLVAGLILAVVSIVALEWWRTPLPTPRAEG